MAQPNPGTQGPRVLIVEPGEPVYLVPLDDGREAYIVGDEPLDETLLPEVTRAALGVIGAWSDLDWDEMVEALDRIRHESTPTPPIDDL